MTNTNTAAVVTMYVVFGFTGEYEDRRDWMVRAFPTLERAQAFVDMANEWCRANGCDYDRGCDEYRKIAAPAFDPKFSVDYTGVSYSIIPVDAEV